jgi:hypothetical protein
VGQLEPLSNVHTAQAILEDIPSIVYVSPEDLETNALIDDFKSHQRSLRGGRIHLAVNNQQNMGGNLGTLVSGELSRHGEAGMKHYQSSFGNRMPVSI